MKNKVTDFSFQRLATNQVIK